MNTPEAVIYLLSCAANDIQPEEDKIREMNLDQVYVFASRHMLSAMTALALERAGFKDDRSSRCIAQAIRREVIFSRELQEIECKLDETRIWYVPLKGIVLKEYYPYSYAREMADHDLLVDAQRAEDVKHIMEDAGFTTEYFGGLNHDVYHKEPILNYEMHTALYGINHDEKFYHYYQNVKDRLIHKQGCEYAFSAEDFYIYIITHAYKHYQMSGTGLRTLLDSYLYLKKEDLDWGYVETELEKLGIREYERNTRALTMHLFSGEELSEQEQKQLQYYLSSGTHGTTEHRVQNVLNDRGWSKLRYMVERFQVPLSSKNKKYTEMAAGYPFFYKHKILLLLLPFYRIGRSMKHGRFRSEAKALWKAGNEKKNKE